MPGKVLGRAERALRDLDSDTLVSLYADTFLFEDTSAGLRIETKQGLREYFELTLRVAQRQVLGRSLFRHGRQRRGGVDVAGHIPTDRGPVCDPWRLPLPAHRKHNR